MEMLGEKSANEGALLREWARRDVMKLNLPYRIEGGPRGYGRAWGDKLTATQITAWVRDNDGGSGGRYSPTYLAGLNIVDPGYLRMPVNLSYCMYKLENLSNQGHLSVQRSALAGW